MIISSHPLPDSAASARSAVPERAYGGRVEPPGTDRSSDSRQIKLMASSLRDAAAAATTAFDGRPPASFQPWIADVRRSFNAASNAFALGARQATTGLDLIVDPKLKGDATSIVRAVGQARFDWHSSVHEHFRAMRSNMFNGAALAGARDRMADDTISAGAAYNRLADMLVAL